MKKARIAGVAVALLLVTQPASAATRLWLTQFGTGSYERVMGGAADAASNFFVVGGTRGAFPGQVSAGCEDAFVTKLDAAGHVLWSRQFGTPRDEVAAAAATDGGGNVYVAGTVAPALASTTCQGEPADAALRKLSPAGAPLWSIRFGTLAEHDFASAVAVQGSALFVGGQELGRPVLKRYTLDGALVWSAPSSGITNAVTADASGVYVTGWTPTPSTAGDALVAKYSLDGAPQWQWRSAIAGDDQGLGLSVSAGALYVAGSGPRTSSTGRWGAPLLARLDPSSGAASWTVQFTASDGWAMSVASDPSGGAYLAGVTAVNTRTRSSDDAFVWKVSAAGAVVSTDQSALSTSGSDEARSIVLAGANVLVAGDTSGRFCRTCSAGSNDAFATAFAP